VAIHDVDILRTGSVHISDPTLITSSYWFYLSHTQYAKLLSQARRYMSNLSSTIQSLAKRMKQTLVHPTKCKQRQVFSFAKATSVNSNGSECLARTWTLVGVANDLRTRTSVKPCKGFMNLFLKIFEGIFSI
jgi:hypothetical protein